MPDPDPRLTSLRTRAAIGAHSRPLRFLIVTLVVAVYMALGFLLHLNIAEYQVLGVPMLLVFQLGIQRQPLRTLWVRSGPALRLDAWFFTLWVLFSLIPAYEVLRAVARVDLVHAPAFITSRGDAFAVAGAAITGAFGLAYALRAMRAENVRQLGLCLLTVGGIVLLPLLLGLFLRHALHLHFQVGPSDVTKEPGLRSGLQVGGETFLLGLPAGFMVEEVFFRGALDTYLHRGEEGIGWLSAIFVSALWGLWHLPGQAIRPGQLVSTIVGLLVAQLAVGVPLSLWWRRSGNLTVTNTTHAVLDAVRNSLAAFA